MKKILLLITLAIVLATMSAAAHAAVTGPEPLENGLQFRLENGLLRVQFWSAGVVRITFGPPASVPLTHSLSVVAQRTPVPVERKDDDRAFGLASDVLTVKVDRSTGAVAFFDATNRRLLREAPGGRAITPGQIGTADVTACAQSFELPADEGIYGLGQHQSGAWNYNDGHATVRLAQQNREVAVPVMTSSKGYLLLWDNPAVTTVTSRPGPDSDASRIMKWSSESGGAIDYYFCYDDGRIETALQDYRRLTGDAPLLPKWFFGLWQCKERYASQAELLGVAKKYRELGFPVDGIIQDWQYWPPGTNTWGSHEFDPARYPDPTGMFRQLHAMNFHALISVWAKFDLGSKNSRELTAAGAMFPAITKYVWPPGQGQWYDPFKPAGRAIYWRQLRDELYTKGVDGWWLDAPEPEIGGMQFRSYATGMGPGYSVYNAYPLMHTTGVYQGQRATTADHRVVILTRSAYAGQQRNSAVTWSGDIGVNWEAFRKQIPAGLNFALSGLPYWNTDTGGFGAQGGRVGAGEASNPLFQELFTRWFQFSTFCPMLRVHGGYGLKPGREIWLFDPQTQRIVRHFTDLRYRLLPYLYSTAWQVTSAHAAFMRPLVMDFAADPQTLAIGDQYLFGPALMVTPVTTAGASTRSVYLPATAAPWYDFWTGDRFAGGQRRAVPTPIDSEPLFVKPGAIIPMGPFLQYANEKPADPIELRVYRGADGQFTLYEDEGDNYDYEHGGFATIALTWNEATQTLTLGARRGSFPGMVKERTFNVVWVSSGHGAGVPVTEKPDATIHYTGAAVQVRAPART